jgi:dihydroorotase
LELLIKNATSIAGDKIDLLINNGVIQEIAQSGSLKSTGEILEANEAIIGPGLVDLHTHLREPGREDAETLFTGAKAAVAGGFTAVTPMANTSPVADNSAVVELIKARGMAIGICDFFPVGAVTKNLVGTDLAEISAMADSAAKVRIFSDDGKCVSNARLMRRAMEYIKNFDGVISQHAQEPELTLNAQMNEGYLSGKLGLAGWPAVAEESIIARDIQLAKMLDARIHIAHLSTAGSVELVRSGKAAGVKVTAEVTPHHLYFDEEVLSSYDPIYKVNPPLRTRADIAALTKALADGVIDIVATDHAPHPVEDKEGEFATAAFGMMGLQSAASVVAEVMVESGLIDWKRFFEILSIIPAKIGGYQDQGQEVAVGNVANLVLIANQPYHQEIKDLYSKSINSPYISRKFNYQVAATIYRGSVVYSNKGVNK